MNDIEMAKDIIKKNKFLSLATINNQGEIWCTPLSYAVDDEYNFYFVTAIDSKHIEHIKDNPYVAFTIFDSTKRISDIDGLQIKGLVGEIEKEKLEKIVSLYYKHVFPDPKERAEWEGSPEDFTKEEYPIYRFFQIFPTEIYKRDTVNIDVDRRIEINIQELKRSK